MRPLLLLLAALVIPCAAWGPIIPFQRPTLSPTEFVRSQARAHNVPEDLAMATWDIEASLRTTPPDGVKNGVRIARGAFQMTRLAAIDAGCGGVWDDMNKFGIAVTCGVRFLALKVKSCGSPVRGAHAYYNGKCARGGKVGGYAMDVSRLMMKHSQRSIP